MLLVLGATAAAGTGEQSAQPITLVEVRGRVDALAQNGRRVAWVKTQARCGRQVEILTLPGRRPVDLDSRRGSSCGAQRGSPIHAIALSADGRVLHQTAEEGNTYLAIRLLTSALRDPRTRPVAGSYFQKEESDPDWVDPNPLPMAGEGKAILYYTRCDASELCVGRSRRQSAIYRLVGRRSTRIAKAEIPVGFAVSGRRLAIVTNSLRCCSFAPSWSHDGTRLAWIFHGNLWTIRADGMGDRQLASGVSPPYFPGAAQRPSWSPDGARLVFDRTVFAEARLRSLGLYVVEATGGRSRRLAAGTAPAWSPDGTKIAFVRGTAVFTIRPDGTGETRLTATARATAGPLSWSPDSMQIAVSRGGDIYAVRADGAGETRLTTTSRPETQPGWSPDGSRIAYVDGSTITVVNADGTRATRLPGAEGRSPAWSPDSKRIAFGPGYPEPLWAINADGSGRRQLTPTGLHVDWPQWAPGNTIVVGDGSDSEGTDLPNRPGIRLVTPVDGKSRLLAPVPRSPVEIRDARTGRLIKRFAVGGYARAIALGPDYVALLVDHDPGARVELYSLNGSRRRAVAVPSNVRNLSAAGRSVLFAAGTRIRRLDARTGAVTTLATTRWAPVGLTIEGRRVVWAENVRGAARIRALRAP
jgi:TolB protein